MAEEEEKKAKEAEEAKAEEEMDDEAEVVSQLGSDVASDEADRFLAVEQDGGEEASGSQRGKDDERCDAELARLMEGHSDCAASASASASAASLPASNARAARAGSCAISRGTSRATATRATVNAIPTDPVTALPVANCTDTAPASLQTTLATLDASAAAKPPVSAATAVQPSAAPRCSHSSLAVAITRMATPTSGAPEAPPPAPASPSRLVPLHSLPLLEASAAALQPPCAPPNLTSHSFDLDAILASTPPGAQPAGCLQPFLQPAFNAALANFTSDSSYRADATDSLLPLSLAADARALASPPPALPSRLPSWSRASSFHFSDGRPKSGGSIGSGSSGGGGGGGGGRPPTQPRVRSGPSFDASAIRPFTLA